MPIVQQVTGVVQALSEGENPFAPLPTQGAINFAAQARLLNRIPNGVLPAIGAGPGQDAGNPHNDPFWVQEAIDPSRWNKRFPYQLLVVTPNADGSYAQKPDWEFTLPIPPESMVISTPFAISTQVTLGGIVEEHNGAPIKMINFSGTTGVLPNRQTAATGFLSSFTQTANNVSLGLLAGTIQNATQTVAAASRRFGFVQQNLMDEAILNSDDSVADGSGRGTGYYQMRLLQVFLESYAAVKKQPQGKDYRLAVAIWKDQAVYLVTPMNFEVRRSAADPLAYSYNMQFKAWRRVSLGINQGVELKNYQGAANNPALLQTALGAIQAARATLEGARASIEAVRGDAQNVFDTLRQTVLLLKDTIGVGLTAAELPKALHQEFVGGISDLSVLDLNPKSVEDQNRIQERQDRHKNDKKKAQFSANNKALADAERATRLRQLANNVTKLLQSNSPQSFKLLSNMQTSKLQLKPSVRQAISDEIQRVRRLTRSDFEVSRDQILELAADYADAVGVGSTSYDQAVNRQARTPRRQPTETDFQVLFALNRSAMEMGRLSLTRPQTQANIQTLDFVAGLARSSGIAFTRPVSKTSVPFPYGATLEQLSLRYLGDANRWHEIATLNGLKAPYVDEVGFDVPLAVNGKGRQLTIEGDGRLYVKQSVTISSRATTPTRRRITKIDVISPTMTFITVDGEDDLARFKTSEGAQLHAYQPDTVNSLQQIFIPSERAVDDELTSTKIPNLNNLSSTLDRGGVDLMVLQNGDAAIAPDGDWRLAVGLTNLVQRVRIALGTTRGSLPQHPEFGFGLEAGMSTSDLDANQVLAGARGMFAGDPDFTGVHAVNVRKDGDTATITVGVGVGTNETLLPVSVEVVR